MRYLWCDVPCCENSREQQPKSKRFNGDPKAMFSTKKLHHSPKSTYNEENKTINFRMFFVRFKCKAKV